MLNFRSHISLFRVQLCLLVISVVVLILFASTLLAPASNIVPARLFDVQPDSHSRAQSKTTHEQDDLPSQSRNTIVTAVLNDEDTSWMRTWFENFEIKDYVRGGARLSTAKWKLPPGSRGTESAAYLTHIIDSYDDLPPISIFIHPTRYQWHNDNPLYDTAEMLHDLRLPYVQQQGYVNLRCTWLIGCPQEFEPKPPSQNDAELWQKKPTSVAFYFAFQELFPEERVPARIGVSCCNQFAATREQIRKRPKSDYLRFRDWLQTNLLDDETSGRVMEYAWHIIMGQDAIFCPDVKNCYCNLYGYCDLDCEEGSCPSRYMLPRAAKLPSDWPASGWPAKWKRCATMKSCIEG